MPSILKAQDKYPSRAVRFIVAVAAGGPNDIYARLLGQWLSDRLGQPFIIENRPGAGTNLATEMVVRSPPDGYTIITVAPSATVNATLYPNLKFNFLRDIAPVASFARQAQLLVLHPSVPVNTVGELVAYAKANPGKLNYGSAGIGTGPHMAAELFKLMAGVDIVHVPYRGASLATQDTLSGQVQMTLTAVSGLGDLISTGKLKALGVSTAQRSDMLPDVPTIGETVPGYESSALFGVGAPAGTPREIIELLNREINAGLRDPGIVKRMNDLGGGIFISTPEEYGRVLAEDTEKYGKIVRAIGARMD
jgi:tripartite-type tricarboxylate transporter receptor subunit TctC